eukprot:CAMPEP_0206529760 /NCGR_PEP_ID=MMETSP0325_2-20121206/2779_1 /ASSEMBLY_ACC=CAM_ASM_000347 /TAXON_ID=2866 /ORGANISM="Crypthecodinium cohnii, Strain Seligo" /LENGTH=109 /DNA_ID=CAMNT_0054025709 /DNA_START=81 /DNA_END=410 /DNA_ORIENTATION=+
MDPQTIGQLLELSHSTASATSSGLPIRPVGKDSFCFACHSGQFVVKRSTIAVSVVLGQIPLIRMPFGAYSLAAVFVKPITACLLAQYGLNSGIALFPAFELVLTMDNLA